MQTAHRRRVTSASRGDEAATHRLRDRESDAVWERDHVGVLLPVLVTDCEKEEETDSELEREWLGVSDVVLDAEGVSDVDRVLLREPTR